VIIADENIEVEMVALLRSEGHTVEHIAETSRGALDDEILERAEKSGALLLTEDKDFGELVYRKQRGHSGVVLVRLPEDLPPDDKASIVAAAFRKRGADFPGRFSVITPGAVRIRKP
jgi:predicted nuclease of predicted toxin-antitoxin system